MMKLLNEGTAILQINYKPQGFNLAAGAGIAEHMHIVPGWNDDTNFITSVGETRVLPEELETTYERGKAAW